eukprot:CAMPEP_0179489422 /NCGR_PEP_ID=MMETSP0799-20121207/64799_1 /TAXON_ID=46947 /ORGANISM="Geminigera cryophila, Strain CCMP2564" /LENGTH=99 /DNA_ID=CAMNT_0021305311 /DNA_START=309 /DNA_END=608 /DNA_ORIENTATION=+
MGAADGFKCPDCAVRLSAAPVPVRALFVAAAKPVARPTIDVSSSEGKSNGFTTTCPAPLPGACTTYADAGPATAGVFVFWPCCRGAATGFATGAVLCGA